MVKEIEIPEGYEAKIVGNKVVLEPKESEYERIREYIINFVELNKGVNLPPDDADRMLAFLERQKDAGKAIEAVERIDKYIDEHTANAHDMKDSEPDKKYYSGVDDTLSNIAGILNGAYSEEKQKEQKPAEWSEFDKGVLNDAICAADMLGNNESFNKDNPYLAKAFRIAKDWLKYLPERFNLQPKTEWNEEDWKLLDEMREHLMHVMGVRPDITPNKIYEGFIDLIDKLKSLRPQSVQLKESYKEGFQTARRAIATAFMEYCDKIRPNGKMCLSNGECEEIENAFLVGDWKKIERYFHKYSWKPSKAQITALKVVARGFPTDDPDAIDSLLHDLKKLI